MAKPWWVSPCRYQFQFVFIVITHCMCKARSSFSEDTSRVFVKLKSAIPKIKPPKINRHILLQIEQHTFSHYIRSAYLKNEPGVEGTKTFNCSVRFDYKRGLKFTSMLVT